MFPKKVLYLLLIQLKAMESIQFLPLTLNRNRNVLFQPVKMPRMARGRITCSQKFLLTRWIMVIRYILLEET